MKRSVISILVQSAYRSSLTLLDNFTARADYIKCLLWLQTSSALREEDNLAFQKPKAGKSLYIESIEFKEPLGGFVNRCLILDHASLAGQFFPQVIGRGLRRDVPTVIYDEDCHPSEAAFNRAIERMRSMRVLKSNPLTPNELDKLFDGSMSVTSESGVKWEDFDKEQTLAAIKELHDLNVNHEKVLERRRQEFLNGIWEPEFKEAYERDMVKKGGH